MNMTNLCFIWILLILSYLICFNIWQENERIDQLQIDNSQMNLVLTKIMR